METVKGTLSDLDDFSSYVFLLLATVQITATDILPTMYVAVLLIAYISVGFPIGRLLYKYPDSSSHQSDTYIRTGLSIGMYGLMVSYIGLTVGTSVEYFQLVPLSNIELLYFLLITSVLIFLKVGFEAEQRYDMKKQPYQLYDWWPQETHKLPLLPYYAYKSILQRK